MPSGGRVSRLLAEIKNIFFVALFPSSCRICGQERVYADETVICRTCRDEIRMCGEPGCRRCGRLMASDVDICAACSIQPPPYVSHRSFGRYEENLKKVIWLYKYGEIEILKNMLTRFFLELYEKKMSIQADAIIPVPADRGRKREFQPILEIAKILAKELKIELLKDVLLKSRSTPPQVGLSHQERLTNLRNAFKLQKPEQVKGRRILLIDDVYTTGTTIKTCSRVLKKIGTEVHAMTLAQSHY